MAAARSPRPGSQSCRELTVNRNSGTTRGPSAKNTLCDFDRISGADDAIRTRDPHLGKVMLYP